MGKRSPQERLEASAAGRAALSGFIAVTVASLVVWNLPQSEVRRQSVDLVRPYVLATGLTQNWGVFAPDPRRLSKELVAEVRYADGSVERLGLPRGGRLVGGYWDYRFRKWMEWATSDSHSRLWGPTAAWFARRALGEGREPVKVTLVRRWRESPPPGDERGDARWKEQAYYTYDVEARRGVRA